MANVYHWLTGSRDDVYSGKRLNYGTIVTNSSRYGSDSAFQVGTTTNSNDTMSTNYTYGGSVPVETGLPNLGTGDATIAFWWQPNNSAYGGSGQRHLFQYSTGLEVYHNASISTDTQDDYNLVAKFNYGDSGGYITKTFDIDLTGNPWIKIYASRIGGAFYYTLFDATGSVITDNDGNQSTWSNSSYTSDIYNASGSIPHIRVGGDFASGQTAGGIYDDIFLTLGHGIAAADLETDSDGYAKIDPVINSFSTSAASATNGSSVTLSWNTSFGTTLELLKYVGGLLTNTETVTGQVSKSVTISETVSYKLRATNVYGSVDSESVEITLSNGGNNMAISGSNVIVPVEVIGALNVNESTGALSSSFVLPMGTDNTEIAAGKMLNTGLDAFSSEIQAQYSGKTVIFALNALGGAIDNVSDNLVATARGAISEDADILEYDNTTGVMSVLAPQLTSSIRDSLSVTDSGGDGSLSYNASTGVITYAGPSAAEVRAHLGVVDSTSIDMSFAEGMFTASLKSGVAGDGLAFASQVLSLDLNELTAADVDVAADSIAIVDGGDNSSKKESIADLMTAVAGVGLKATSGVLSLDASELSDVELVSGDKFVFLDATDNSTKLESLDDLATTMAGDGINAAVCVFALNLNELTAAAVDVAADSIAIVDASDNSSKKESIADLVAGIAGTASSTKLSNSGGVISVDQSQDFTWTGDNKFAEPLQLLDREDSAYFHVYVEGGFLKVSSSDPA